jgi:xanthine dehydrogenase YagS FAD-binding subunit
MRPFTFTFANDAQAAVQAATQTATETATQTAAGGSVQYLAGGTTLVDLMKLDVMRPSQLIDITRLAAPPLRAIDITPQGLTIGALATMREVADHPGVRRDYPVVAESLWLAASQQIRNMARVGGNVLQRTRCAYFRDTSWPCNKRTPGSGCSAMDGENRWHAVLGASDQCIASYPGDWATALIALDATVQILGTGGARAMPFAGLHRPPGSTPHIETTLAPGELITSFVIPAGPHTRRSLYLKVRDRESYEFALASAAVALELDGDSVRQVRIGIGGPVAVPWRAHEAEALLVGKPLNELNAMAAARAAFAAARPRQHNAFRIPLGQQTLVRALLQAQTMELSA